jgi:integrase
MEAGASAATQLAGTVPSPVSSAPDRCPACPLEVPTTSRSRSPFDTAPLLSDGGSTPSGTMGKKGSSALPPRQWIVQVDGALAAACGVTTRHLLERNCVLVEWFARAIAPSDVPAAIDPIDLAVARWLAGFKDSTWQTYERALRRLAAEVSLPGIDDARALLRRAAAVPDAVETLLARQVSASRRKTGTIRSRLCALHRATVALRDAGVMSRAIDIGRPEDTDVDLAAPNVALFAELDSKLAASTDPIVMRARAEMLLAADGLRAREICNLNVEHFRNVHVAIKRQLVSIAPRTTEALKRWLEHRGTRRGPLFVGFDGRTCRLTFERLTTRALERDMARVSGGAITLRAVRRYGVVDAVGRKGWIAGDRVARLTRRHGVTRMVEGARNASQHQS